MVDVTLQKVYYGRPITDTLGGYISSLSKLYSFFWQFNCRDFWGKQYKIGSRNITVLAYLKLLLFVGSGINKSRIWEMKGIKYARNLNKIQVSAIFHLRDIRRNDLPKFKEICMEMLCWCASKWAPTRPKTSSSICHWFCYEIVNSSLGELIISTITV